MDLTTIADDCLERLARGETLEACVAYCRARYPEAADQVVPMLFAASHLRVLSQARLTAGQRLRAKVALREELAAQGVRRERGGHPLGIVSRARLRMAPLAALVAVLLFVGVGFSAVAASQPGDIAYPVRVAVERAPALVQLSAARRAAAELAAADRRLSDLALGEAAHPVAVSALLSGDEAAIERAASLSESEQAEIMGRVAAHAAALARLADEAVTPEVAERLRDAAEEALALTGRSKSIVVEPTPTRTASPTPRSTLAAGDVRATATPRPATRQPATRSIDPAPTRSPVAPAATATPQPRPRLSVTPPWIASRTPVQPPLPQRTLHPRPTLSVAPPEWTPRPRPTLPVAPPEWTPRPRPTLPVVPPMRTPQPRWTLSVMPPERTPQPRPTLSTVPPRMTAPPVPTFEVPPVPTLRPRLTAPIIPTFVAPTLAAPTIVVPTIVVPTLAAPIVVPTIVAPTITAPEWRGSTITPPARGLAATPVLPELPARTPAATRPIQRERTGIP